jgi:hypothetical protein
VVKTPDQLKEPECQEDKEIKEIVRKIYILESSGGKHDSCHKIGKENGFGYGIYKGKHTCFDSHEEVTAKVEEWFRKKLKVYDLRSAVCIYNTGKTAPCAYYQKFKSLK